jgi:hypothetical protein
MQRASQKIKSMFKKIPILLILFVAACGQDRKDKVIPVSSDSLQAISKQWKEDSLGCSRLRDVKKITQLINQLSLREKDSLSLVEYLGFPNERRTLKDGTVVFCYYMGCSVGKISSYNFYCYFENGKLTTTQTMIWD